jgi:hypothetical protein
LLECVRQRIIDIDRANEKNETFAAVDLPGSGRDLLTIMVQERWRVNKMAGDVLNEEDIVNQVGGPPHISGCGDTDSVHSFSPFSSLAMRPRPETRPGQCTASPPTLRSKPRSAPRSWTFSSRPRAPLSSGLRLTSSPTSTISAARSSVDTAPVSPSPPPHHPPLPQLTPPPSPGNLPRAHHRHDPLRHLHP